MQSIADFLSIAVGYAWGPPLVLLLVGGGLVLTIRSRFLPFQRIRHATAILRGKYDHEDDPGQISHFQALTTALSSTIGVGNIGGVAVAITQGGPGAVFWMWVAALVGMATKFFTCTLAVMYRGRDASGALQGGPMYYIEEGLGKRFRPLAIAFAVCGLIGCLPIFQSNQMAEILAAEAGVPPWMTGIGAVILVLLVAQGGVERIGAVTSRLVPLMCVLYLGFALAVVAVNFGDLAEVLTQIVHDAFNGTAAMGGAAGIGVKTVIQTGVRRAAFSNEAGIGTAPLAHGAAKTKEPVREGLIAMLGPFIDTIVVCSLTAFVILSSGLWRGEEVQGVTLTSRAFEAALGPSGPWMLTVAVVLFGGSTMVGYSYYGKKCANYLFGSQLARWYEVLYLVGLFLGAIWTAQGAVDLIDTMFALMAVPNMTAALVLAPRVMAATRDYFRRMAEELPR